MSLNRKCPVCGRKATAISEDYHSGKKSKGGSEIIVENVLTYKCSNKNCGHAWLPLDQDRRIDRTVASLSRFDLAPAEISLIRNSLPFENRFQAAEFLCLNEKAFTKWEGDYSAPNRAYDLLLRLAVYSRENFSFIQHLHQKQFYFDPQDYQLVCDKLNTKWNFDVLGRTFDAPTKAPDLVEKFVDKEEENFVNASVTGIGIGEGGSSAA